LILKEFWTLADTGSLVLLRVFEAMFPMKIGGGKFGSPGAFLTPGSGMEKIPDHISKSLDKIFWVKNT
jgi:hypothetical protein